MKRWIKIYTTEWLNGSIRVDLSPAERSVWTDLLALAGLSRREGYLERSQGIPLTIAEIADHIALHDEVLIKRTIEKCSNEGRISQDETGTYYITNWSRYQSQPEGKGKIGETSEERELRKRRELLRLQREYPDMAVSEKTIEVVDEEGKVITTQNQRIHRGPRRELKDDAE